MNNVKPLDEIDTHVLFSENEEIFLFDKGLNKEVWRTSMYDNPSCGLLGLVNEWAVIGGKHLIVWIDDKLREINVPELNWIYDMRQIADDIVEILIDPWSEQSAVWQFNVRTLEKKKVKDFGDFRDLPYQEQIKW